MVSPAWEATPWEPEERVVAELQSNEPPLHLSDEHVVELYLEPTGSIVRVH